MTTYVILSRFFIDEKTAETNPMWSLLSGTYDAPNDEAAIKAALLSGNGAGDPSGEYVAVPVRSWKPRKVEAKQAFSFS